MFLLCGLLHTHTVTYIESMYVTEYERAVSSALVRVSQLSCKMVLSASVMALFNSKSLLLLY